MSHARSSSCSSATSSKAMKSSTVVPGASRIAATTAPISSRNLTCRSLIAVKSVPPALSIAIASSWCSFSNFTHPVNPETGASEHGTVTSEARRMFENLKLLLESAGSSLDRVVQVHAMIYDRIEYDVLNRVYRHYVPDAPPARTVMSVQIEAGFKVMLDVTAAAEQPTGAPMTLSRDVIAPRNPAITAAQRSNLPLSPAIRAGDFVFLSGMAATDPATGQPAHGTVAAEARQILTNMGEMLEAAGSSLAKVVKVNVLMYSMLEYGNMDSVY